MIANKARVLLVGRDRSALRSYSTRLAKAGFEVAEASRPAQALRHAEDRRFDVLVTDFRLPEMDGLELIRRLRKHSEDLRSVLILDAADNRLSLAASEMGVFQFLIKPIEPQILQKTVDLAVRLSGEKRPNVGTFGTRRPVPDRRVLFRASRAKNEFGRVLEKAIQGDVVLITKHDAPKAVLISVEEFDALASAPEAKIDRLSAEFDALLSRMQLPAARDALESAFHASPAQLGRAAVAAAARKRG